ncbi:hypothetical protein PI125_g18379 [Phytophthora idaei]|nr:hypothetical protein PI125_g18379 [Phytophthora idaei]KAG3125924.1 hypothetical protein PI126_g22552 [Phytophthora idaei]
MIKCFFAIKDFTDTSNDELAELMPTRHEENKLRALQNDLRDFISASKKLQSYDNVTLLDVRDFFDAMIEHHPSVKQYSGAEAAIVKSPVFDKACVQVLLGQEAELTAEQHVLLRDFAVPAARHAGNDEDEDDSCDGFTDRAPRARKEQRVADQVSRAVRFLSPTANAVERLLSKVQHV